MTGQRVVVTGTTGMDGGHALRLCLESAEVATVTTVGRAMVHAGLHGIPAHPDPVLENRDIRVLVRDLG
jgi:hypothetical protein